MERKRRSLNYQVLSRTEHCMLDKLEQAMNANLAGLSATTMRGLDMSTMMNLMDLEWVELVPGQRTQWRYTLTLAGRTMLAEIKNLGYAHLTN